MLKTNKVIVVGAGAAGMMAAGIAAQNGADVTVIDKNKRPGRKLMITGKGRCNITNDCDTNTLIESVPKNGRFLYSAVNAFSSSDTISFFNDLGLKLKVERGNRVFPESDKAVDVVDTLFNFVKQNGCRFLNANCNSLLVEDNIIKGIVTENGKTIFADAVILATGGMSYPLTGSTGDGYRFAKEAGHTVVSPKASLVPLESSDSFCKELQGLTLKNVSIKVNDTTINKVIYSDFGEMLFTHFGISGPVILSASSHMREMSGNRYNVSIDLKPALSIEQLDARIQRDFAKFINKEIKNSLYELLPHKLVPVVIKRCGIDPMARCNQITKQERQQLVQILKDFTVSIQDFRPIEEAIITSGGVSVNEINPKTMESKLVDGLFFAGELIDVDAYTGGFNLQIAFSTGYLAGISASRM
ncbi:MAG: NAD(P)/FAD-dependent oxidoreductase [Bacillota bacterium]|nr:NAD(P)/FAD-dependent oxidoreductase [Bacillota bacterium]